MKMNLESSLKRIVKNLNYNLINGEIGDAKINKVVYDSRKVEDNDLFICLNGARFDSHTKINDVINKGAKVIVVEENNENVKF